MSKAVVAECVSITPAPQAITCTDLKLSISSSWQIVYDQNLKNIGNTITVLNNAVKSKLGYNLATKEKNQFISDYTQIINHESSNIFLMLYNDPLITQYFVSQSSDIYDVSKHIGSKGFNQGYLLFTYKGSIYILANSAQGIYYGMQSLRQVIEAQGNSVNELYVLLLHDIS
jgi:hypothetical protein